MLDNHIALLDLSFFLSILRVSRIGSGRSGRCFFLLRSGKSRPEASRRNATPGGSQMSDELRSTWSSKLRALDQAEGNSPYGTQKPGILTDIPWAIVDPN